MKERTEMEFRKLIEFFSRSWNAGRDLDKKIARIDVLRDDKTGKRRAILHAVDSNRTVVGRGDTRLDSLRDLWKNVLGYYGKSAVHIERQFDEMKN